MQPFTDFERDWTVYADKLHGTTYTELVEKYKIEYDNAKKIVKKIKK